MRLSFKNRIALYYMISAALLIVVLFVVIYGIVYATVFNRLNENITYEAKKHAAILAVDSGSVRIRNKAEWLESEHRTIEVNPVFIQIIDSAGQLIDKSPNLKEGQLSYNASASDYLFETHQLSGEPIRQTQLAITEGGQVVGYLLVAMSQEEAILVLANLKGVLLIAFPLVLLVIFLTARLIAGRSIRPVSSIIHTASKITRENLDERIDVPPNQDELSTLVVTINNLLDRIEYAIEREKRFTADASHELRTPLAVMKGTLEVLVRKPRPSQEYVDKIDYCLSEINRMNHLVDQLLLLARFESQKKAVENKKIDLTELIDGVIRRQQSEIIEKKLTIQWEVTQRYEISSDPYMVDIILENLLSNAVKYSTSEKCIAVVLERDRQHVICRIKDEGIGMPQEELTKIFERFYRSEAFSHPHVRGSGLGLSIVKRMCDLLFIDLAIESAYQRGTQVQLTF